MLVCNIGFLHIYKTWHVLVFNASKMFFTLPTIWVSFMQITYCAQKSFTAKILFYPKKHSVRFIINLPTTLHIMLQQSLSLVLAKVQFNGVIFILQYNIAVLKLQLVFLFVFVVCSWMYRLLPQMCREMDNFGSKLYYSTKCNVMVFSLFFLFSSSSWWFGTAITAHVFLAWTMFGDFWMGFYLFICKTFKS